MNPNASPTLVGTGEPQEVKTPQFEYLSPATLQQCLTVIGERMIAEVPDLAGVIVVTGRWANSGRARNNMLYDAVIADDGGSSVKVDVQLSLVHGRGIEPGMYVDVWGRVVVRMSNYGLDIKLMAANIRVAAGQQAAQTEASAQGAMTIERLRALSNVRVSFPERDTLRIMLVRSRSAGTQVDQDCLAELDLLGSDVEVQQESINILDPVAIAQAIRSASQVDVLMLIRGGGQETDFAVFDDPRVVEAMAKCRAHRVVGLGHSGNNTILDVVADYSSRTPAQAGAYVRERVQSRQRTYGEMSRELRLAREQIATLRDQNGSLSTMLARVKSGVPVWLAVAAFVGGAVLVLALR